MGATRNVALNELNFRGISINAASGGSSAIEVVPSDSGLIFINKSTAEVTYTLPSVALGAGKMFWFYNAQTTTNIVVNAPTSTLIMTENATATTATDDAVTGSCGMVFCDGDYYYFLEIQGTWGDG